MFKGELGQALGPWGLLAVGVIAGVMASPLLRKGARRLAVLATCGVLSIADEVKKATDEVKKVAVEAKGELNKLVDEARTVGTEGAATVED
ncbi:MAG: hypothetical protein ABSC17_00700 [Thermacetogeniaceae bacterium]